MEIEKCLGVTGSKWSDATTSRRNVCVGEDDLLLEQNVGATVLPSSVRPCTSNAVSNHEDTALSKTPARASPQSKVAVSLRRDDSRIAADLDWHLKAPMDRKVIGNSALFSAEREGDFGRNPET